MYYLFNFIIYSIFGYCFEMVYFFLTGAKLESGFMYGPYTIIYGISMILIFSLYKKFKDITPEFKKLIVMFLSGFVTLMVIECIGGYLLKTIFDISMWSYNDLPLHLGKYISIEVTTVWTILTILVYFFLKPKTDKLFKKTPNYIIVGMALIMSIDFFVTLFFKFFN